MIYLSIIEEINIFDKLQFTTLSLLHNSMTQVDSFDPSLLFKNKIYIYIYINTRRY